nr:unnamed protein product [Digitaria exilis]
MASTAAVRHPLFTILVALCCVLPAIAARDEHEGDRVVFLPGQPRSPAVSQFSGHCRLKSLSSSGSMEVVIT